VVSTTTDQPTSSSSLNVSADTECLICSERRRDTLLKPCNHIIGCESCSARCKRCLVCKTEITERVRIDTALPPRECEICSERPASVRIEPCGHVSACEQCAPVLKKCITCRSQVHRTTSLVLSESSTNLTAVDSLSTTTLSAGERLDRLVSNDVAKLKQELQGLKEQVSKLFFF
jgi:E3 ubiquitin-protein ligase mind-bomb